MVLVALAIATLSAQVELPAWTYSYPLPESDTVAISGVTISKGRVLGGGGPSPAPKALQTIELADLVPGLPKNDSFLLGSPVGAAFVARAQRETDRFSTVTFSLDQNGMRTRYAIDESNRVRVGIHSMPVSSSDSESHFATFRRLFDQKFGAPTAGARQGDRAMFLEWERADGSGARLGLSVGDRDLQIHAIMAGNLAYGRSYGASLQLSSKGE